jgi:teichuronic acid biosynthesis glycosyltransferase TuaH
VLPVKNIKKPIIGYIGALNSERLDIKLLTELATRLNDYNFILVGQEDAIFEKSDLHKMPNVHFTGNQDFSQLPNYLYSFDVAINPQLFNEITIGNYPRKIDEFLAAGIPAVATETPTMMPFSEYVYLGKTVDDYITLIHKAIAEDSIDKRLARKEFASNHNWKNSVGLLLQYTFSSLKSTRRD